VAARPLVVEEVQAEATSDDNSAGGAYHATSTGSYAKGAASNALDGARALHIPPSVPPPRSDPVPEEPPVIVADGVAEPEPSPPPVENGAQIVVDDSELLERERRERNAPTVPPKRAPREAPPPGVPARGSGVTMLVVVVLAIGAIGV